MHVAPYVNLVMFMLFDRVPALDLGRLADKEDRLHNPIVDYEEKLDPSDTASTVR